ncbi:MAG: hybrid sensor histidine kinase/response regulator [Deltaproteobacteria bacterium]|nr:hybrid sensor histidine kinase/response regulator [Deltaproteobacteria bacterium]
MPEVETTGYKVLVVDDEPANLENFTFNFGLDYPIVTATGAAAAWEVLDRENVSVIVCDQRMPGVSGIELLTQVKQKYPKVVRILLTAYADLPTVIAAINEGNVYRFVSKDSPLDQIEAVLRQAIEYFDMKRELEAANRALVQSEKLVTIAEMAAGIGHEIKNSLSGMLMGIHRMDEELRDRGLPDPVILRLLEKTKSYATRTGQIVERLNDFSKPGAEEDVDLGKVVQDSIELARDGLGVRLNGMQIVAELDPGIPLIKGNYVNFEQVFINLIRNACQAMEETGGTILIRGSWDGDSIRIAVHDTGLGIPPENLQKVFGAFYTTKKEGMGMGLYIIDNIIKTFGGRLELQSEVRRGSTFTVVLPSQRTKQEAVR